MKRVEITFARVTLTFTTRSNNKFFKYFIMSVLETFSLQNTSEHIKTNLNLIKIYKITIVCNCN